MLLCPRVLALGSPGLAVTLGMCYPKREQQGRLARAAHTVPCLLCRVMVPAVPTYNCSLGYRCVYLLVGEVFVSYSTVSFPVI